MNPNKNIPPITYKDCVQQEGLNYGLHVLLNIKHFISRSNHFLEDPLRRHLNVNIKRWYDREEVTRLRFIIVNLLSEIADVRTPETIQAYSFLNNNLK